MMDWLEDEDEREAALLERLEEDVATIKDLTSQQKSQALVICTRQQNACLAAALLDHGANPNEEDEFGCTPLMFAATHGLQNCLEQMVKLKRCTVNKRSHSMQTALHFAAKKGQVGCVQLLLNSGAMVNVADDWGETPLMLGVRGGSLETVQLLLNNGARLEMTNLRGMNALIYAAQRGHTCIMEILIKHGCLVSKILKTSPLHQAALYGHVDCVHMLLKAGARADERDVHGILPIELATHTDKQAVVKCLIEYNTTQEYKDLALAAAAKSNGICSVHALIRGGADPGATDMQGIPAFFWAVAQNNIETVKYLIQNNVDINKGLNRMYLINSEFRDNISGLDLEYVTAVVLAALRENCQMVQILVQAGSNASCLLKMWEIGQLPQNLSSNTTLISWLAHHTTCPRSLALQCRQRIRELMSTTAYQQIQSLPLPKPIQDFLYYADLDQF